MRRALYIILFSLITFNVFGQDAAPTLPFTQVSPGMQFYYKIVGSDTLYYGYSNNTWTQFARAAWVQKYFSGGVGGTVPGGPITTLASVGKNPGINLTGAQWIINTFYGNTPPTATLTGGTLYEKSATNKSHNLNYSYGRNTSTVLIKTDGTGVIFSPGNINLFTTQPAAPGSVPGVQAVTTTANVNTTYTLTVTAIDGSQTVVTTSDTFLPNTYWGRTSNSTPTNSIILAIAGGGNVLNATRANSSFTVTASGSNSIYYAYPTSYGALTSLKIGGFESINAFTQLTISVTNASGFTENFYVYVSNNTFSATTPTIAAQ